MIKMSYQENNNSVDFNGRNSEDIGNGWITEKFAQDHLKSYFEILYCESLARSRKDKVKFVSFENECGYNLQAGLDSSVLRKYGLAHFRGANETIDDIRQSNFINEDNIHIKSKYDCTCSSEHLDHYMVKDIDQEAQPISRKYPTHQLGELVVSKLPWNEAIKCQELIFDIMDIKVDYKPQLRNNYTSCHCHFSYNSASSSRKICSKNGHRFFQDVKDRITIELELGRKSNMSNRFNGFNLSGSRNWCERGFNCPTQRLARSPNGDRYFDQNDSYNVGINHGNGKKLTTTEFRAMTIFRSKKLTLEALRMLHTSINKFLQFYQNVSVYDMEHKDLYLRVDNKAHLNRELIIPKNVETQYLDMNHDTLRTNQSMIELRDQFSQ